MHTVIQRRYTVVHRKIRVGVQSPLTVLSVCGWIYHKDSDAWPVRRRTCGYLSNRRWHSYYLVATNMYCSGVNGSVTLGDGLTRRGRYLGRTEVTQWGPGAKTQ